MKSRILINFDLKGAEWVIVAYLSQDENMLRVVREGLRPHAETGHLISGAPVELIMREREIVGESTDPSFLAEKRAEHLPELAAEDYWFPRTMSIYQCGKKSNHGFNYRLGHGRWSLENEVPLPEAKVIRRKYLKDAYPGIEADWWKAIDKQLRQDRTLTNLFGYKRRFLDAWSTELKDAATAYVPQSTVFEVMRRGMIVIYNEIHPVLKDFEILQQVHDNLLCQALIVSPKHLASVIEYASEQFRVPLVAHGTQFMLDIEVSVGFNAGKMTEVDIYSRDFVSRLEEICETQEAA